MGLEARHVRPKPPSPDLMSIPASPEDRAAALFGDAVAHHQGGRLAQAVDLYLAVVALSPAHAPAHANLAVALRALGRRDEALASLDRAIAVAPHSAARHYARGNVLRDLGRQEEALSAYERALSIDPGHAASQHNRAFVLEALGRTEAALEAYALALALGPDDAEILTNRGNAFYRRERMTEALADYGRVLALRPLEARSHYNHAKALEALGRLDEALAGYERALDRDPGLEAAYWERSRCLLKLHQFAEGWADYEHRWREARFLRTAVGQVTADLRARLDPDLSVQALAGRWVLVVGEQGVGDILMFASILPDLARDAAEVTLLCEPRLQRLFRHSFPGLTVIDPAAAAERPPRADHVVAIGSLGRLYRDRREDFPGAPYLAARPEVRARWEERLGARTAPLRVGISWRGGVAGTGAAGRSMTLADLAPVLGLPMCEFVSLQYGDVDDEVAAANRHLGRPIRLFPAQNIGDFEDLAALTQSLDVVVSVQTAIIHLAGAVGQRALVMVPHNPEWRYGATGEDIPWYRSVRLERQAVPGAWAQVIERVARRLSALTL